MKKNRNIFVSLLLSLVMAILPIGNGYAMMNDSVEQNMSETTMQMHHVSDAQTGQSVMINNADCIQCDNDKVCSATHCSTFSVIPSIAAINFSSTIVIISSGALTQHLSKQQPSSLFKPPRV